jgi:hypothetical protein
MQSPRLDLTRQDTTGLDRPGRDQTGPDKTRFLSMQSPRRDMS